MSHFACADEPGSALTSAQIADFRRLAGSLGRPLSLSATGGILLGQEAHFDLTRAGIGLYGGLPFAGARRVVALDLPIIQIREVPAGATVGYGATWRATRPSRIATISGGYANGLLRALGSRAVGFVDGEPAPFVGRVSMDMITLDVTCCRSAVVGTMVEILGPHQSIDDLAKAAGTIGYEILTLLGSRFQRRYRER
jgi:alanine racemase